MNEMRDYDGQMAARLAAGRKPPAGKAWVHVTMFRELAEVEWHEVDSLRAQGILASVEAETPLRQPAQAETTAQAEAARLGLDPGHAWEEVHGDYHSALMCSYSAGGCGAWWSTCCDDQDQEDEAKVPCEGRNLPHAAHNPYPAVPIALRRLKSGPPVKAGAA